MNSLAVQQNTRALKNLVDKLTTAVSGHGMYCSIREVNTGDLILNKSGVYVMCGLDEKTVSDFSTMNADALYELAVAQETQVHNMFPKCTVFHFTCENQLFQCSNMLDQIIMIEFLRDKAKEFGIKNLPSQIDTGLLDLALYYYTESLKLKYPENLRHELYKSCKNLFDFFGSKYKNIEDYYKDKDKTSDKKDVQNWKYIDAKEYISKSPNQVEDAYKLVGPNRQIAMCSVPAQALPELEKILTNKGIKYFINKEPIVLNDFGVPDNEFTKKLFSDKSFRKAEVYYTIQFDSAYAPFVNGYVNAEIYSEVKDHAKHLPLITNSDRKMNVMLVPVFWAEAFVDSLKTENINFIYDIDGTYTQPNPFELGFVFDSDAEYQRAANIIIKIAEAKMNYHAIDKTLERAALGQGKDKEQALKELEMRGNNKIENISR